jgi:hypothetical protein
MAPEFCECCPILFFVWDQTKVYSRDGIGNSVMSAFYVHDFGAKFLQEQPSPVEAALS